MIYLRACRIYTTHVRVPIILTRNLSVRHGDHRLGHGHRRCVGVTLSSSRD